MTVTQTIDIPANRRIHLDFEVSREVPAGKALVSVTPLVQTSKDISLLSLRGSCKGLDTKDGKLHLTLAEIDELMKDCPHTEALVGILSDLGDITIEQIRDERLAKHLK